MLNHCLLDISDIKIKALINNTSQNKKKVSIFALIGKIFSK